MKKILIIISLSICLFAADDINETVVLDINETIDLDVNSTVDVDNNKTVILDINLTDNNLTIEDSNITQDSNVQMQNFNITQDSNLTIQDQNLTQENNITVTIDKTRKFSKFEKTFINHIAYNSYKKAIEFMYKGDHTNAYNEAIKAKDIYKDNKEHLITLPYIPGYVRESGQTPKRIYYKIIEEENYEIKRLIKKIKLLNPPIPMIVFNKTSTYIDISVTNVGDTPFDNLSIDINFEEAAKIERVSPNETKTIRYNTIEPISNITFSEEYGFAPKDIEFETEE